MISERAASKLFKRHYDRLAYMRARYWKAAKKRRVLNKWRKRYTDFSAIVYDSSFFLARLDAFSGKKFGGGSYTTEFKL